MNEGELPTVRETMSDMGNISLRSAAERIESFQLKGIRQRDADGSLNFVEVDLKDPERAETVNILLVGDVAVTGK